MTAAAPTPGVSLADCSQEILLLVAGDTLQIIDINPYACVLLGYDRDDLIGRPITDLECALQDVFYWEEIRGGEFRPLEQAEGLYACANGDFLAVQKTVGLRNTVQPPVITICARDARLSVTTEQHLARVTSILSATFESTAEGFLVIDHSGGILNYNQRFLQVTGLLIEGTDATTRLHMLRALARKTKAPRQTMAQWRTTIQPVGEDHAFSMDFIDGRSIQCRSRPLMIRDQVEGRVITVEDITDRIQRERELAAARDAASASAKAKAEFLAMMSHEIRTPLTGVLGMTELTLETSLNPLQREHLEMAHQSASGLLAIINDILDFSRIEAGKMALEFIPMDLGAMLRDVLRPLQWQAQKKGNVLQTEITLSSPLWVRGDPVRIRQILVNLVGNAIKFTTDGRINVRLDVTSGPASIQQCRIAVRDTGIGIPEDKLALIFEAFSQSDSSINRRFGGTGLGLSISSRLAHLMGGHIEVDSAPGAGSCFTLCLDLPICPPQRAEEVSKTSDASERSALAILLAEDTRINQVFISTLLSKAGHCVTLANNGQEAVDAVLGAPDAFDVVLMDIQMPVMDGFTATRRLRDAGFQRPIIALTAHAAESFRDECLSYGMDDYLAKPINSKVLLRKLDALGIRREVPTTLPVPDASTPTLTEPSNAPPQVLDVQAALDLLDGDQSLYVSLVEMSDKQLTTDLASLRAAVSAGQPESIAKCAHRLKGCLGTLGATQAYQTSRELELAAKARRPLGELISQTERLEQQIDEVAQALSRYLKTQQT